MKDQPHNSTSRAGEANTFRQQVRMAAVQVDGLTPDELAQALAYEVEPFSGIPATEAEVTYKLLDDFDTTVRVYDVTVRRRKRHSATGDKLERLLRVVLVLAGVACVGLALDGILLVRRKAALANEVAARQPLQAQLDQLRREARAARDEAAAIRARREAAVRAQDEAAALRGAHAEILGELAAACHTRVLITSLAPAEEEHALTVRALGVSAEAAAEVMRTLATHLAEKGWLLVPDEIKASGTGASVNFQFHVKRKTEQP